MRLIFATNNANKVKEVMSALPAGTEIISLRDAGIDIEIPEPHDTLEANASEKATVIYGLTKQNCFSEDTGLEVAALNGEPGVRSARYAGDEADNQKNISLLLRNMSGADERSAQFKTVISLILDDKEYQFTGICKGRIINEQRGTQGFGYDSIFIPEGDDRTFAEMNMEDKNTFSHRKKALMQLISFLNSYHGKN